MTPEEARAATAARRKALAARAFVDGFLPGVACRHEISPGDKALEDVDPRIRMKLRAALDAALDYLTTYFAEPRPE